MDGLTSFPFHFSPKHCKYTIITIINSNGSLHFHPFPTLRSQGTIKDNDKGERGPTKQVGKGSKRCSDVRSAVNRGRFWSADLGFATMYGMRVKEMCMMSLMRHEAGGWI